MCRIRRKQCSNATGIIQLESRIEKTRICMAIFENCHVVDSVDDRYQQYGESTGLASYRHLDHWIRKDVNHAMTCMERQRCAQVNGSRINAFGNNIFYHIVQQVHIKRQFSYTSQRNCFGHGSF